MLNIRRFFNILKRTGLLHMFTGFIICYFAAALVLFLVEPQVTSYADGLWFCFVAFSTIGFGDITAVTLTGRITVILITIYAMVVLAMIPGVVVSYFTEYLKAKGGLDGALDAASLSKEELADISKKVKRFNNKR